MKPSCRLFLLSILCLGFLVGCQPARISAEPNQDSLSLATPKSGTGPEGQPTALPQRETSAPTQNPTPTPQPSRTATLPITPSPTDLPPLPESAYIEDIYGYRQWFSLSCEARAAVDWAAYFGVTIYEYNFQNELPLSDNPDLGFVGSVQGPWGQVPPYAYGVHAEPVAALLREYGLKAAAHKKYTLDQVRQQLAAGKPVIAWVIGNVEGGVPYLYTDAAGNQVQVGAYEHVVILTGYGKDSIRYLNNSRIYDVPADVFDNSWAVLDRMVIVMED